MSIQESQRFPKSYGDFALQSSDGTVCYFPQYLLMYMSPVFKDMMEIGSSKDTSDPEDLPPLQVTETSTILEEFLSHLDPKTIELTFNEDTIQELLAAAHKYQVGAILDRFEKEMTRLRSKFPLQSNQSRSLMNTNPLFVLSLAETYGLTNTAREASRILTCCPSSLLEDDNINLSFTSYRYVTQLRKDRIKFFQSYIQRLTELRTKRVTEYDRCSSLYHYINFC
jgi:hypothetical protein